MLNSIAHPVSGPHRLCSRSTVQADPDNFFCRSVSFIFFKNFNFAYEAQVAAACDQWRQVAEGNEHQPAASSSGASQLPFWLLAKAPEGKWQATLLTAFPHVSFFWGCDCHDRGVSMCWSYSKRVAVMYCNWQVQHTADTFFVSFLNGC